jgi:hypothetical protein
VRRHLGLTCACLLSIWAAPALAQSGAPHDPAAAVAAGDASGMRGRLDRMRTWTRDIKLLERMGGEIDGWYPRLGGVTRGSGFAAGPGLRGSVLGTRVYLDASGAISTKGYKAFDARARWLQTFERRVELWTEFRYEDFSQEDFFGTGMATTPAMRTSYDFNSADVRVRGVVTPRRWAKLGVAAGFMRPAIGTGSDPDYPSIEERFTDAEAPGLLEQPDFVHTTISADIDYRDLPGNPARGGLYQASLGFWNDVSLDAYDFRRVDAHAIHYVPLTPDGQHVLSGLAAATYVNNATGNRVPFYFLAYVGGMDTIRSFREFRFKDENAMWLSAEYKWRPRPFLSISVFADAGETRANWEDVDLRNMRTGYGAGVGLHSAKQTIVRFDLGTGGGEGWQFFIKVRPTF